MATTGTGGDGMSYGGIENKDKAKMKKRKAARKELGGADGGEGTFEPIILKKYSKRLETLTG